ncbi:PREDICTED: odorant receptor 4-like [Dufourea novaeangliae]|uniref:odorant receptor 4-like n=1 Tax=Dufourea novaeangliae TaxID=178035 RepID=UPI000767CF2B|nr:PREDICTED: odorant receptor 4-like [Dufourea novaeangliae]
MKGDRVDTVSNVHHVEDYNYSVQVNQWILKPSVLYILFEQADTHTRMQAIGPMSHWMLGGVNYCCLSLKSKDILSCIEHLETDWKMVKRPNDRQLMLKNAKVGRLIVSIAAVCMNVGVLSHTLIAGFKRAVFQVGNESYSMLRLPCPVYTQLMDVRFSPLNEIVFFLQCWAGLIVNLVTTGACGFAAVFAMHACGQLDIVMLHLEEMVEQNEDQPSAQKKLGTMVDIHLRALDFVSHIESVMHITCLIELTECTLNMCMLEYYMITENSKETAAAYGIIYISMTFNIFIFCYIAEKLTEQCKMVGETAYMTEWYRLPYKTAAGLILVILRAGSVTRITAGKILPMSLSTFADVVKTSFVYLNMLRTVAE